MNNSFAEVMSKKTNHELVKIVTVDKDKYQPLAVEAAEFELSNRNIDPEKLNIIQKEIDIRVEKTTELNNLTPSSSLRFANFLIDTVFFGIISQIFFIIIGSIINIEESLFFSYVLLILLYVSYYTFFESNWQKTIGKFITKTKVVNFDGETPSLTEIIFRSFCRLIPFDRISFLFTKNGFHDSISKTKVIKD
ncbi:RDD family protein [Flavobacterium terrae]|uniref:Uncharacterized membrane protein YckC, RDD family n=1 Tax=Flavobacterium terrae TaxID=415425 RepID=A0A1M6CNU4_9FLAO|nr:RDD family protein [Flavobacterium terrae]SHI62650.1 Uncharacterized membrane protein YckC, RDD family [Flavobacterium terrae]